MNYKLSKKITFLFVFIFSGCIEIIPKPVPDRGLVVPEVNNVLLQLINQQERFVIDPSDFDSTSLKDLITLGTPAGYRLRLRYSELGISLVEGLKTARDPVMLDRLFELAQWSENDRVRSEALVTLGSFSDPNDLGYFKSALIEKDLAIRFAAIEGLQLWRREGALDLLKQVMSDPWSPLLQVYAAQAVLSLGDESGLKVLYQYLDSQSWIVKAMAARYLGDYAKPDDYRLLLREFQTETDNDFVAAELAIATLKLISQTKGVVAYSPFSKKWDDKKDVAYTIGEDNVVEMEPLIIKPPRLFIPESVRVTQAINNKLLDLIQNRIDEELNATDKQDPNLETLFKLVTPASFALQTRYSELSVLLVDGLGGVKDEFLRTQLIQFSQGSSNPLVQASSLLSLAYNGRDEDIILVVEALNSSDPIVRFGAMEAIFVGRFKEALPTLTNIAYNDPIPAFQVFAMQLLVVMGDASATNLLIANIDNEDWPARAMTYWYLGRYGNKDDYKLILSRLATEKNPFVLSEMALAASRLKPFTP